MAITLSGQPHIGEWLHSYLDFVAEDCPPELKDGILHAKDWVAAKLAEEHTPAQQGPNL